jgi:hypothetical protein
MKIFKFVVPALVLAAGLIVSTTTSSATPAIAKKENVKSCTTCHAKAGSKDLNDVGKCYKEKKSMKDCAAEKK